MIIINKRIKPVIGNLARIEVYVASNSLGLDGEWVALTPFMHYAFCEEYMNMMRSLESDT